MGGEVILVIDPGEVHIGMAEFEDFGDYAEEIRAYETSPKVLFASLVAQGSLRGIQTVVLEEFRLYPWRMKEQGFSQIKTAEVIGVVRYLCGVYSIEIVQQPASIKNPTDGILKTLSKGARFPSYGHGPHARDAELHGWHYFRRYLKGDEWENCKW